MKNILGILILLFTITFSCNKEEQNKIVTENGVIVCKSALWLKNDTEHDQFVITTPFTYNDSYIGESNVSNKSSLALFNANNGQTKWIWSNYEDQDDLGIRSCYSYKNLFAWQNGKRTYCINLDNGQTVWKKNWENPLYIQVSGFQELLFLIEDLSEENSIYPQIKIIDIQTGNLIKKITPKFENTTNRNVINELGSILDVKAFVKDQKTFLLINYTESIDYSHSIPFVSLFNYSDEKWVYERVKSTEVEKNGLGLVDIKNDKFYLDGANHVICNDLWTGKSIWIRKFSGNFLFGSCTVENSTIYAASEGDGYYALDANTGNIKWKGDRAPGTSSKMVYLNGVVYYVNGGDGRLWALDAETGQTLWKLKSPDNNFGFKREINVLPGDGKRKGYILTSTWHGACAYEAER